MYNNVYESGLSFLRIKGESGSSGTSKGYWSPDSVNQETVLPVRILKDERGFEL